MIDELLAFVAVALVGLALAAAAQFRRVIPATPNEVRVEELLDQLLDPRFAALVDDDLEVDRSVDTIRITQRGRLVRVVGWAVRRGGSPRVERVISVTRLRSILIDHVASRRSR